MATIVLRKTPGYPANIGYFELGCNLHSLLNTGTITTTATEHKIYVDANNYTIFAGTDLDIPGGGIVTKFAIIRNGVLEFVATDLNKPWDQLQIIAQSSTIHEFNSVLLDGNDTIVGSPLDDTIRGGAGSNDITGGGGNDAFIFDFTNPAVNQTNTINDYVRAPNGVGDSLRFIAVDYTNTYVSFDGTNAAIDFALERILLQNIGNNLVSFTNYTSLANAETDNRAGGYTYVSDVNHESAHNWVFYVDSYDSNGLVDTRNMKNDNNTRTLTDFDNLGNQAWSSLQYTFGLHDRMISSITFNDNATSLYLTFDPFELFYPSGHAPWTYKQSNYDNLAHLTNDITYNDDGTSLYLTYDPTSMALPAGSQTWASKQANYDDLSHLTNDITYNDNGTSLYLTYDPENANPVWHDQQANYDSMGRITNLIIHNDNLTANYTTYDADHSKPWQYEIANYDAAAHLVLHYRLMDDNTIVYL